MRFEAYEEHRWRLHRNQTTFPKPSQAIRLVWVARQVGASIQRPAQHHDTVKVDQSALLADQKLVVRCANDPLPEMSPEQRMNDLDECLAESL